MIKRCVVLAALCLIFAGSAPAQQWSSPKLTTDVPFDFVVNGTTLPAGTYLVRTYMTGYALMIQNRDNRKYTKVVSNNDIMLSPNSARNGGGFVFLVNNGQHVLHQVRLENDNHTHDVIHGNDVPELVAKR